MSHLIHSWFAFPDGGIWSNLVASAICLVLGYLLALWHLRCVYCRWRPGRVAVKGTVHHACKLCAQKKGHTH